MILLGLLIAAATAVCAMKSVMASVIIFSAYSVVKSIVWIFFSAPDLAITEAAVSTGISGVLYFIVLKRVLIVRHEYYEHAEYKSDYMQQINKMKFRPLYNCLSVVVGLGFTGVLTYTVSHLPPFGHPDNPTNNEVPRKFLEQGVQDSGALNAVASMLFEYRAFDTLGEAAVLIAAVGAVLILLRDDGPMGTFRTVAYDVKDPKRDIILRNMSILLVGIILMFGAYVVMNGHLTPGGGFSGGAILGAGLILYVAVFDTTRAYKFLNYKISSRVLSFSLLFYVIVKGYKFFVGANDLPGIIPIPLGTPGELFSAGVVMPLNISVGLIVASSIYMMYILFSQKAFK
jgi:multicomponent Na+:H+ antiporter subunit B